MKEKYSCLTSSTGVHAKETQYDKYKIPKTESSRLVVSKQPQMRV